MIKLSVAMPMYNAGPIAWLALEGLCRQEGIDFEWELLIAEEIHKNAFGSENLKKYLTRLKKAGCRRIEYLGLTEWEPLSEKWYRLSRLVSESSYGFLLQAADCFDYPTRLKDTYEELFLKGRDWVQGSHGIFYNIPSGRSAMFRRENNLYFHPCGLNMAISTRLIGKIPQGHNIRASVDSWLYQQTKPEVIGYLAEDNFLRGFDSDGFNNISKARATKIKTDFLPFEGTDWKIRDHIPAEIVDRLEKMRADLSEQSPTESAKPEHWPSVTIGIIRSREDKFFRAYNSCIKLLHGAAIEVQVFDNRKKKYKVGKAMNEIVKKSKKDMVGFVGDDDTVMRDMLIALMEVLFRARAAGDDPVCVTSFMTLIYEKEPYRSPEQKQMIAPGLWKRDYLLENPFDEDLDKWITTRHYEDANSKGYTPAIASWNYGYLYHIHDGNMSKQPDHSRVDQVKMEN